MALRARLDRHQRRGALKRLDAAALHPQVPLPRYPRAPATFIGHFAASPLVRLSSPKLGSAELL
jgi:hypothetical protein